MSALMSLLRQLAGLFVDDGWLAFAILCIIALAAVLALLTPRLSLAAGAVLLFGCLGVLLVNVIRAAQHERVPCSIEPWGLNRRLRPPALIKGIMPQHAAPVRDRDSVDPTPPLWFKSGNPQNEQIMSALPPPKADIERHDWHVRFVPILLQKSPKRKAALGAELQA